MDIAELLKNTEPYTREQFDAARVRVVAILCAKHGIAETEIIGLIRTHAYEHSAEDPEDEYIQLLAISRVMGWPILGQDE